MRDIVDCAVYFEEFKRPTKVNSFVADGRIIRVVKKDHTGKSSRMYVAYDSYTKIQLVAHHSKDEVIRFLQGKDLSILGVDNTRLF